VEHADLGQVPWVVPNGDRFTHERGQRQGEVPQSVTADAVPLHLPRCRHGQQQQVERFGRVGHPGQPATRGPAGGWGLPGLRVHPPVVGVHDVPADGSVQLRQGQRRRGDRFAMILRRDMAGQSGQQLGGDRAEQTFEIAPTAGFPGVLWISCTFTSAHTCARCELVKSAPWSEYNAAGKPHTVHPGSALRHTACRNANAVCSAEGSPRNTVYPATAREMVVLDHRQPRPGRLARLVQDHHVKFGVIGLPQVVGVGRFPPENQFDPSR
jgi:hypothetical protein